MGNFNRGRFNNNRSFGGKRDFRENRHASRPQMHSTICSNCGKECQVPFLPTEGKPVYCRECFAKMNPDDARKDFGREDRNKRPEFRSFDQPTRNAPQQEQQLKAINAKLDKILAILADNPSFTKEATVEEIVPTAEVQKPSLNEEKPAQAEATEKKQRKSKKDSKKAA